MTLRLTLTLVLNSRVNCPVLAVRESFRVVKACSGTYKHMLFQPATHSGLNAIAAEGPSVHCLVVGGMRKGMKIETRR